MAFKNRGNAYNAKGEHDRAIQDYDQAIRLNPNLASAFSNRAKAYSAKSQFARELQDLDQAIRLDPKDADAYFIRGKLHWYWKVNKQLSLQDLSRAIQLGRRDADTYAERGMVHASLGQRENALRDYDQAIQLDASRFGYWRARCEQNAMLGRAAAALPDCDKSIALYRNEEALAYRALAQLQLGNLPAAEVDCRAAIAGLGDEPLYYFILGMILEARGDRAGANQQYAEVKRFGLKRASPDELAKQERELGRFRRK